MTIDNDFNLQEMTQSQSDKYVTHNTENRRIAAAVAGSTTLNFSSDANMTINSSDTDGTESWRYQTLVITDSGVVLTTGRDVILPSKGGLHFVINKTAQTLTFKTSGGTGVAVSTSTNDLIIYNSDADDYEAV